MALGTPLPAESSSLLSAIITSSDDAIISKDLHGIVQSWNPAAERIFGYTAEEMIGNPITRLFPAERLDEEPQILARLQRGERVDHFETVRVHKNGTRLAISATISPIHDPAGKIIGASKVARDITSNRELEARYKAIITTSDDAIISKDLNGIVKSWNLSAERMFGYTADEMIDQSITKLFPPDRLDEEPKILDQLRRGQRVDHFETVRLHKDGRLVEVSVTISPIIGPDGLIIGVSKVARDISSIKRALREREALLQRETAARAEAERISRMKDEFLATLSHELRTPLNAILGWATILRTGGSNLSPEEHAQGLDVIERNARAQAQLIEELLDMSRIINGKLRLDVQAVDLQVVISEALESVAPAAESRGIRLTKVLDPKGAMITGDPNRLQQVLWNLLTNAIKFTPKDGRVQVFLSLVNSHVEISIVDSGQGIPSEFLPHVFTRFSQAETSLARQSGGLGLGLALVKSIVEMHGGNVKAHSDGIGKGATFIISLPQTVVRQNLEPMLTPAPSSKEQAAKPDLSGFRVLVIDDAADARHLIQHVLTKCQATVLTAANAAEGLAAVKEHHPHMILSDIGMPGEDGYEFLAKLRRFSDEDGGDTPAVALTAFARPEDRRRALLAGFQMHLPKPVDAAELIAVATTVYAASRRAKARG